MSLCGVSNVWLSATALQPIRPANAGHRPRAAAALTFREEFEVSISSIVDQQTPHRNIFSGPCQMNHLDAFHQTVHAAPGGCEAIAHRMGMSPQVLRNKANPNSETNKPTLDEADRLMGLTGDFRILEALAQNHGFVLTKIDEQPASDMAVLESMSGLWQEFGNFGREVHEALADGRIEQHEIKEIDVALFTFFRLAMQVRSRLNGMAEK
jgi:hypothetical protein